MRGSHLMLAAAASLAAFAGAAHADYVTPSPQSPDPYYLDSAGNETYVNGILMRNLEMTPTSAPQSLLTPPASPFVVPSFFDVFVELSPDGGTSWLPYSGTATAQISENQVSPGVFQTELTQLDVSFGGGVLMRESPTLASNGETVVTGTGPYQIHSFFDVFTEISLDNGGSWSPSSSGSAPLFGAPEPATFGLLAPAALLLLRRRK